MSLKNMCSTFVLIGGLLFSASLVGATSIESHELNSSNNVNPSTIVQPNDVWVTTYVEVDRWYGLTDTWPASIYYTGEEGVGELTAKSIKRWGNSCIVTYGGIVGKYTDRGY